jgi:hypothetical protein
MSSSRGWILAVVASAAATARAGEWELRATAGGQIDSESHGVVDVAVRKGPFSATIYTDTLDLRFAPESAGGRAWIAARGEALFAGLLSSRWSGGAPDPSRSMYASYAGAEGGFVRYLGPIYLGAQGLARVYRFDGRAETRVPVPGPTPLFTVDGLIGRWTPELALWVRAGADLEGLSLAPHVQGEAVWRPSLAVAPRFELRAGWGMNQSDLTKTRAGGSNPYVVPVAGAGWAEWLVQDYVAGRLGVTWRGRWVEIGALADAAAFEGGIVSGFAATGRVKWRTWFLETELGWAPWIERKEGVSRVSLWFLLGTDWVGIGRRR